MGIEGPIVLTGAKVKFNKAQELSCLPSVMEICVSFLRIDRPPEKREVELILAFLQNLSTGDDDLSGTLRQSLDKRTRNLDVLRTFRSFLNISMREQRLSLLGDLYKLALSFPDRLTESEAALAVGAFYIGVSTGEFAQLRDEIKAIYMPLRTKSL